MSSELTPEERRILYHGTTAERARRILEEGLRVNGGGWCYLSPTPASALQFGPTVLQVLVPNGVRLSAFEDCSDWEVLCWAPIPPECVSLLEGATDGIQPEC